MSNTFSDKNGADVGPFDFNTTLGRKAAAASRSFNLSNEDLAAINALGTLLTSLNGYVDGLESKVDATNTKLDSVITALAAANASLDDIEAVAEDATTASRVAMADEYETVAASATDQVIGATGATGDRLAGILINPATTSPGNVIIKDGSTTIYTFAGGASSVSNLATIAVPLGLKSVSGAWKVTTGANVSVIAIGDFS